VAAGFFATKLLTDDDKKEGNPQGDKESLPQEGPYRPINNDQPREYADQAAICRIGDSSTKYIAPTLIREDLLTNEYKQYINNAFSTVTKSVDAQKNTNITNNSQNSTYGEFTDAEMILHKTIYPRYIHHFFVARWLTIEPNNSNILCTQQKQKPYYKFSGITREQSVNVFNESNEIPYFLTVTKSFAPDIILREQPIIESVKIIAPGITQKVTKDVPIINDKKFICGVQTIGLLSDNFYNIYVETVTPQLDQIPILNLNTNCTKNIDAVKSELLPKIDDSIIFTGKNNTNITYLDPKVNLYFLSDFNSPNTMTNTMTNTVTNNKYWFARLDSYKDPLNLDYSNDPTSPYYGKPKTYPVGIIPADYIQCTTIKDGMIYFPCKSNLYINGIDYSDARKIEFEVASVQLNPI